MATFTWTVPSTLVPKLTDETAAAVGEYLAKNGNDGVVTNIIGNPYRFVLSATTDPTPLLNAYAGQPTAARDEADKARTVLNTYLQAWRTNKAGITNAQVVDAVAAVSLLLKRGGYDD